LDDFIDQPVSFRFLGGHEIVAVRVFFHLIDRFSGVLRDDSVQALL